MIEVVVFIYLYSICCSIIEDRVCVFGVCFCCDIATEIPHRIFVVVEGAFTAETLARLASIVNDYNENKLQQQQQQQNPFTAQTLSGIDAAVSNKLNLSSQQLERIETNWTTWRALTCSQI